MEPTPGVLEINLISAQGLKPPSANLRRMQTYAIVYLEPNTKLRTRIDRLGSQNPSWNDKFLFKVTQDFLSRETSSVSFEIYAVGCLRDPLVGTVRFFINNVPILPSSDVIKATPSVIALQVRRPSGRFQGILNIAVAMNNRSLELLDGVSGIGYRDLMGGRLLRQKRNNGDKKMSLVEREESSFCGCNSEELSSDSGDSCSTTTTTSCSSATSTVLKDWNSVRELAGNGIGSDGGGLFCGLLNQRRYTLCFSDFNPLGSHKENH